MGSGKLIRWEIFLDVGISVGLGKGTMSGGRMGIVKGAIYKLHIHIVQRSDCSFLQELLVTYSHFILSLRHDNHQDTAEDM